MVGKGKIQNPQNQLLQRVPVIVGHSLYA
jgi:hypothetical protein